MIEATPIYRFHAVLTPKGVLTLPPITELSGEEVDVLVIPKTQEIRKEPIRSGQPWSKFIEEWAGCIKGVDPDKARYDYLAEKYR